MPITARRIGSLVGLMLLSSALHAQWTGAPSPHDGQHLLVLDGADFHAAAGSAPTIQRVAAAVGGSAAAVDQPLAASLQVRHAGTYAIWIRLGGATPQPGPLRVSLIQGGKIRRTLDVPDLRQADQPGAAADHGGPAAYRAYAALARKTAPAADATDDLGRQRDAQRTDAQAAAAELLGELDRQLDQKRYQQQRWARYLRLESLRDEQPFYWWRLGTAPLEPGRYELRLEPADRRRDQSVPLVDLALATTAVDLMYPFEGDISAPPASYIRFRLDALPDEGVTITAALRLHYEPWGTPQVSLNPQGLSPGPAAPHRKKGFTCWYRLQDIENAPALGGGLVQLLLNVGNPQQLGTAVRGATQFATFPHDDYVVREIGWHEPGGLRISMRPDFSAHLDQLRTIRDQAREQYRYALAATGGRLFPLTRGGLTFGNGWGAATDEAHGYMLQTLRLLGINAAGISQQPLRSHQSYGWELAAGHYWPPVFLPFDEAEARRRYDEHYQNYFKDRALYEKVAIFQIADEPGEISREEMSAPWWRFEKQGANQAWVDVTGNSSLTTRRLDYRNCVLEGVLSRRGNWVGLRLVFDDPRDPKKFASWTMGQVSVNQQMNLGIGRAGLESPGNQFARKSAVVGTAPTPFKIVYHGTSAALYVAGRLMHQHLNLPPQGGFGFYGPAKAIHALRLRPLAKGESLGVQAPEVALDGPDPQKRELDIDELLDDTGAKSKTPRAAALPSAESLEPFVNEHWVVGGGMPEAHEGFRRWARQQGLTPAELGAKSWDEVRLLTVPSLVETPTQARLYYHSRRFSGWLTPQMFRLSAEAIARHAPNPQMKGFVALSGHALYFPSAMPLDMFELGAGPACLMPGVSDWMSYGGWRWDSHQAVAYSVAMYNAAARRRGEHLPASWPMMHCVWPSTFRAWTMLANNVKHISFWTFGPDYAVTEGYWSDSPGSHHAVAQTTNRAALADDILSQARREPSRVALLYSRSNEYWDPQSSFADKRATFLGLSHEYFQPDLITEEQVVAGMLDDFDALYVLEPRVSVAAAERIIAWTRRGGLLWACADALTRNEFNEPADVLAELGVVRRTFDGSPIAARRLRPQDPRLAMREHAVSLAGMPSAADPLASQVRAVYDDGRPGWLETALDQGRIVYLAHRAGLTYSAAAVRVGGYPVVWADTGREPLVVPLKERKVPRSLVLSQPLVMAAHLRGEHGSAVMLHNMQPQPCRDLVIDVAAASRPQGVYAFAGFDLKPISFDYADGRLRVVLPELAGEQMLVVRDTPPPADPRLEQMRALAIGHLESDDPLTVSAGCFFAGFFPQWELAEKIAPLLEHGHWEVRRSAAEALGRLRFSPAADGLSRLLENENDSHVLCDALEALAALNDPRCAEHAPRLAEHSSVMVRQTALQVLRKQPPDHDWLAIARGAAADADARVRREGVLWWSQLEPSAAVEAAVAADADDRPHWVAAVTEVEPLRAEFQRRGWPGDDALLLDLAAKHPSAPLAEALCQRLDTLPPDLLARLPHVGVVQRHATLAREIFTRRDRLPPPAQGYVFLMLEHTFQARLGHDVRAWEDYLDSLPGK